MRQCGSTPHSVWLTGCLLVTQDPALDMQQLADANAAYLAASEAACNLTLDAAQLHQALESPLRAALQGFVLLQQLR